LELESFSSKMNVNFGALRSGHENFVSRVHNENKI
jgi:hypothetical protein